MVSIDERWVVAPELSQSFRMVKCQFTQMSFSVSRASQKTVWQSLQRKGNTQAPGKLISGSRRLTFLHESPPNRTPTNPSPITHQHLHKIMALFDPLLSNQLHPASALKEYAGKYASQYMPGSKPKSEPKDAVVVFAAAEDAGSFSTGFMAGLEKGKWHHVISKVLSKFKKFVLWSNTIQCKHELTGEL